MQPGLPKPARRRFDHERSKSRVPVSPQIGGRGGGVRSLSSYGAVVLKNLSEGGFEGAIMPVSVSHRTPSAMLTSRGSSAPPPIGGAVFAGRHPAGCSLPTQTMGTKAVVLAARSQPMRERQAALAWDALLGRAAASDAHRRARQRRPGSPRLGLNASFAHAPS
jgi:hypothetical protein